VFNFIWQRITYTPTHGYNMRLLICHMRYSGEYVKAKKIETVLIRRNRIHGQPNDVCQSSIADILSKHTRLHVLLKS